MEKEFIWYMKKFAKRFLSILLLSALTITYLFMLTGCFWKEYEYDGVTYYREPSENWAIRRICDYYTEDDCMYIKDRFKGRLVTHVGCYKDDPNHYYDQNPEHIKYEFTELIGIRVVRVYFPWSIIKSPMVNWGNIQDDKTKYVISASVSVLVSDAPIVNDSGIGKHVIPKLAYDKLLEGYYCEVHQKESIRTENFIPANISYCFNYDSEPNEGYFFVDVLDETGKLTKPPYDPQRKWYKFDGWYTEPECINKWDFDNDEVTISYDESGNRIYEEIKLYAKWKWSLFGI